METLPADVVDYLKDKALNGDEDARGVLERFAPDVVTIPEFVGFNYYLHDDYTRSEFQEYLSEELGFQISEELLEKIGRPFYEVTFRCSLNTITGEVKLIEAKL